MRGSPVLQRGHQTIPETQLTTDSNTSFPAPSAVMLSGQAGNQRSTEINLEKETTYLVPLSTPMAVKVAVFTPWTYHTQVKAMKATDAAKWTVPGRWTP